MLQNVSLRVSACLHAAARARRAADGATDPDQKRSGLILERSWARSEEFAESLNWFLSSRVEAAPAHPQVGRATSPLGRDDDRTSHPPEAPLVAIVDDHEVIRTSLQVLLESLGHRAVAFASAMEYLGSGLLSEVACLITDLQMPGMSGLELQARLIADGRTTPVIFVTAHACDHAARARALQSGAFGFLSKPCDAEDLIAALDRALTAGARGIIR